MRRVWFISMIAVAILAALGAIYAANMSEPGKGRGSVKEYDVKAGVLVATLQKVKPDGQVKGKEKEYVLLVNAKGTKVLIDRKGVQSPGTLADVKVGSQVQIIYGDPVKIRFRPAHEIIVYEK